MTLSELQKNYMLGFGRFVASIIQEDWDWWTYFDGPERVGKSHGSIWFAHFVSGPLYNIKQHTCYDAETFLRLVDDTPRYGTIILDEAAEAWFNRDFQSSINKALGKASTQIGDRNLNVILNLPSIWLLDPVAIRRHKTRVSVSAPGFRRGKSEWYKPSWKRFQKQVDPFWDLKFIQYSPPLPEKQFLIYKEHKTREAKERLAGYVDQVHAAREKEKPEVTADEIIVQIGKLRGKSKQLLLGPRGDYGRSLVKNKYGCADNVAREVCDVLNAKMRVLRKQKGED